MTRTMKRILAAVVGIPVALLVIGGLYQITAAALDADAYPAPGTLVDVDGLRLHLNCQNTDRPGPTVILLTGMGSVSSAWHPVMRALDDAGPVCAYDRDGTGWSEDSGAPRDAALAASRLHALIRAAGLPGPYVLAGHSYGGVVGRIYADTYAADVAGLVMVDSAHQDMGQRFSPTAQNEFAALLDSFGTVAQLHLTGFPRALSLLAPAVDGLDGADLAASMSKLNTRAHMLASAREAEGWEASAARAREATDFGDTPLVVLVASDWPDYMLPDWLVMQRELSEMSTRGRMEVIDGANHAQIAMDARYAPRVAAAIREVIDVTLH